MTAALRQRQRGLTLLEFTLIAIIVSVLIAFALERIAAVRVHMERAAIEYNVARMREVLALEFAERVVNNRLGRLPEGRALNPLAHEGVVANYTGTRELPPAGRREPGRWYYDRAIDNVVYVPRYPEAIEWPDAGPRLLRWRTVPRWKDVDGDGEFDRGVDRLIGLELVRQDGAAWR